MAVKITHILKDGTVVDSVKGHLVRRADCPEVYAVMERINERLVREYVQERARKQTE